MKSYHWVVQSFILATLCVKYSLACRHIVAAASLPQHSRRCYAKAKVSKNGLGSRNLFGEDSLSSIQLTGAVSKEAVTADEPPTLTYSDLTPIGKLVAGSVEVLIATSLEFISGFFGGYFIGIVTDLPRLLFQPSDPTLVRPFFQEITARTIRMHGKSFRWAQTWGGVSAVFGGFRVATKVVRGGVEDEWSNIISSFAAGAFFTRAEGPQGMLRGALLYGGLTYLLSGGLSFRKAPYEYKEEVLDF